MTPHALGELAGSRQTLLRANVMAAITPIRNPTWSMETYLLEEQ